MRPVVFNRIEPILLWPEMHVFKKKAEQFFKEFCPVSFEMPVVETVKIFKGGITLDKNILQLLGITDPDLLIEDEYFKDGIHYIVLVKEYEPHYRPECGSRMESKGFYPRKIEDSVLQGIGPLIPIFKEKWHCKNCGHYENDSVNFVEPYKHTTSLMPYMIINDTEDEN